jgi:organic radical activating enzyme
VVTKYFPIKTETACKLKWGWSTLYLNAGSTGSCHRSSSSALTPDNFNNFHNTEVKLAARNLMLEGKWPTGGCEYCEGIEKRGGYSDRMLHNSIPGLYPKDVTLVQVPPSILEVYFNNTCNLSCLYCSPAISSSLDQEFNKFGSFSKNGVELFPLVKKNIEELEPKFWDWMKNNFVNLERFHFLGGEPFYQKQLDTLIDFIENNPNPKCEFNIVTNLMISNSVLVNKINKLKQLAAKRKIKTIEITASIDCWGAEQEYVRYGLELSTWQTNFEYLISQKWIKLNINQTISVLTIKTMPDLITKLNSWRSNRSIGHYFSVTEPGPSYMRPNIFGSDVFDTDFEHVLNLMPNTTTDDQRAFQYMSGIANEIESSYINQIEINKLFIFLNEKDRRRNTNWRTTFPWLKEYENVV